MKKFTKRILTCVLSVVLSILMCLPVFAYTTKEDDGVRKNQDETSMHVVYSTTGMLRIMDEGTTTKVNANGTVTVNALTSVSASWGKSTKLAFIEQSATAEEKNEAAKAISFKDDTFSNSKIAREISFSIPITDVGKMIPICRFTKESADQEGAWTDFSSQAYYIVLLTDDLQEQIDNYNKAKEVEELLNKLSGTSATLKDKANIEAARKAYDALTKEQKEYVTETAVKKLTDSEAAIKNAAKTEEVKAADPVGTTFTANGLTYKVTAANTVALQKNTNKKAKKVTIPATISYQGQTFKVTEIANKAFANNKKLTQVVIGKNITKIGKQAFKGDKKLKKITFKGNLVKTVGKKAFSGINKKATFKATKKILKKYRKLIKKAGAPKTAKYKK